MQEVGGQSYKPADAGFCEWIEATCFKVGYRLLVEERPQDAPGLGRLGRRWADRAATLEAEVFAEGAGRIGAAPKA